MTSSYIQKTLNTPPKKKKKHNKFGKVVRKKINTQKSVVFLQTDNYKEEKVRRKQFTTACQK